MPLTPLRLAALVGGVVWLAALALADRRLAGDRRVLFRCAAGAATLTLFHAAVQRLTFGGNVAMDTAKVAVVAAALACVVYERHRARAGRPVAPRVKRRVGLALAAAAVAAYFSGALYSYRGFYHVWDQYHYFVGSRYFRELGYDGLYRCAAVAMDELGAVRYPGERGRPAVADLRAEVRAPGRLIRNLGVDNTLVPAARALAEPAACRARFTPARWAAFRADVRFFRLAAGPADWERMQQDHGYNPPPAWTLAGGALAGLRPAGTRWLQALGALDVVLLLGMLGALGWAFGWRVAALGAVFWGCQAWSTFYWTGGAFLRQDWLFFLVLSVCLARRRWYAASGAALACSALLRVFPVLLLAGPAALALWSLVRTRRIPRPVLRFAAGGALAAAVLVPASLAVVGRGSYAGFARHIRVHERTPLTNHVGLRTLLAAGVGRGPGSARLEYLRDERAPDPVAPWKEARSARRERTRPLFWLLAAAAGAWFLVILRRVRRLWAAQALSLAWLVLLPELTCYYYSFLVLAAPLSRLRRRLEVPLLALAALSQVAWSAFWWNDDRYATLSLLAVAFTIVLLAAFTPRRRHRPAAASERAHQPPLSTPAPH
ncbi:MAG TPA: hypothetical protein VF746_20870 [Longimicrobium sp.]|jgi:hypothetical protein